MSPALGTAERERRTISPARQVSPDTLVRWVPIVSMRVDGSTQHRLAIDTAVVAEYAALMRTGVEFPPVRVWWDGAHYWLSDGFHRVAAAQSIGLPELPAEICYGSLSEAQWDSYAANSVHGIRRRTEETQRVVRLALRHPNAVNLSNVEIAKHLHVPEATLRRWRKKLSSSDDEDKVRLVTRGKTTYLLRTAKIGSGSSPRRDKSRSKLRMELATMKERSSPRVRRVLNILGNWAVGGATPAACLDALEYVIENWADPDAVPEEFENNDAPARCPPRPATPAM